MAGPYKMLQISSEKIAGDHSQPCNIVKNIVSESITWLNDTIN